MKNCSSCNWCLITAWRTMNQFLLSKPILITIITFRTNIPIWPSQLKNIIPTIFFILELHQKFLKIFRVMLFCCHDAKLQDFTWPKGISSFFYGTMASADFSRQLLSMLLIYNHIHTSVRPPEVRRVTSIPYIGIIYTVASVQFIGLCFVLQTHPTTCT